MSLQSLKFIKPHLSYNKGDIAGFDAKTASKLVNKLKVAVPNGVTTGGAVDGDGQTVSVTIDSSQAAKAIAEAERQADQKLKDAERRTADLAAREAALNEREAKLNELDQSLQKAQAELAEAIAASESSSDAAATDAKSEGKPAPAKPPKQGTK